MSATSLYITLSSIPVWVPPLFLLLLVVGLRSTKDRSMPLWAFGLLPLAGFAGLASIRTAPVWVLVLFAFSFVAGALAGGFVQKRYLTGFEGARALLRGEWLTLFTMMLLFASGFLNGMVTDIAPDLGTSIAFVLPITIISGFCSGSFTGRSILVLCRAISFRQRVKNVTVTRMYT